MDMPPDFDFLLPRTERAALRSHAGDGAFASLLIFAAVCLALLALVLLLSLDPDPLDISAIAGGP